MDIGAGQKQSPRARDDQGLDRRVGCRILQPFGQSFANVDARGIDRRIVDLQDGYVPVEAVINGGHRLLRKNQLQLYAMICESLHCVSMDNVDAVVIGGGVVGLAVARALAHRGRETLILEAHEQFGTQTSSRNSEVIHAGIYYPPASLKARLCVRGRDLLYSYCERYGIGHHRCGKLIVATSQVQLAELERIRSAALANGVSLLLLDRAATLQLEPALSCAAALHSPLTGIIDSHAYMLALLGQAESSGATLVCGSRVTGIRLEAGGVSIGVNGEQPQLRARVVINCAGLFAPHVARSIPGFPADRIPTPYFVKGSYFGLAGRSPFQRLIYPIPEQGGLGVHLTLDLAGRARFGPDVQWVDAPEYDVDPRRADRFYAAIREYWPALPDGSLQPAYAGVRPKITGRAEPAADFRIDGPGFHGISGVVNLFGIESPGLTASLALADYVADIACDS
jgi:L-2-hydroxyglutarate oxidase LhgO